MAETSAKSRRRGTRSAERTKAGFLDAAERIFARMGYEGTTIRAISEEAQVQLGALHYYWGNKEVMFNDVLERRLRPLSEERLRRLEQAALEAGGAPSVRAILEAYYLPLVDAAKADGDEILRRLVMRTLTDPSPEVRRAWNRISTEAVMRFARLLRGACAALDDQTYFWRLTALLGAMVYVICNREAVERLMPGLLGLDQLEIGAEEAIFGLTAFMEAPPRIGEARRRQRRRPRLGSV